MVGYKKIGNWQNEVQCEVHGLGLNKQEHCD